MSMLGADMSVPVGKFVVRGEVAEYLDELQTGGVRAASTNALIGLDWYAGNIVINYIYKLLWKERENNW